MKLLVGIRFLMLLGVLMSSPGAMAQDSLFRVVESNVHFISQAPLETIEATSTELSGLIRPSDNSFAFTVPIRSFQGFNSPLQQEHFNENYMESNTYPRGTYSGTIVEEVKWGTPGIYNVRVKGKLDIHNQVVYRIVQATITISEDNIRIEADFTVPLADHDISIPRLLRQKIAEKIKVTVSATLTQ